MPTASPAVSRIRRFDEIDTDSDFDPGPRKENVDLSLSLSATEYTDENSCAAKTKQMKNTTEVVSSKNRLNPSADDVNNAASVPHRNTDDNSKNGKDDHQEESSESVSELFSYDSNRATPTGYRGDPKRIGTSDSPSEEMKLCTRSSLPLTSLMEETNPQEKKVSESHPQHILNRIEVEKPPLTSKSIEIASDAEKTATWSNKENSIPEVHARHHPHQLHHTPRGSSSAVAVASLSPQSSAKASALLISPHESCEVVDNKVAGLNNMTERHRPIELATRENSCLNVKGREEHQHSTGISNADDRHCAATGREMMSSTAMTTVGAPSYSPQTPRDHTDHRSLSPNLNPALTGIMGYSYQTTTTSSPGAYSVSPQHSAGHPHSTPAINTALEAQDPSSFFAVGDAGGASRSPAPPPPPDPALTHAVRRLTAENKRLVDEVNYLTKENRRYRSAAAATSTPSTSLLVPPLSSQSGEATSSEMSITDQVKLQMTVEMLKRELLEREENFFISTQNLVAERASLLQQLQECIEQTEGQGAAAVQYEKLYTEKVKDLNSLTRKYEVLRREVDCFDKKRTQMEKSNADRLLVEKSRADKFYELLEDAKNQREHLQERVLQLQQEAERSARRCRELEDGISSAEEDTRKVKSEMDGKLESARREIEVLKDVQAQRQMTYSAELREERRMYDVLQQSMKRLSQESTSRMESLRRDMERQRDEQIQLLREERQKRLDAESKVQRLELALERAPVAVPAPNAVSMPVIGELEQQLQKSREELGDARRERDDARKKWESSFQEMEALQGTLEYLRDETKSLHAELGESSARQMEIEAQNRLLASTIKELAANEEHLVAQNKELKETLKGVCPMPTQTGKSIGRGGAGGRGPPLSSFLSSGGVHISTFISENERLTDECTRLATERNHLQEENERLAEEFLNWKTEIRGLIGGVNSTVRI